MVDVVQLDGHVLLKIVKHCTEASPSVVTGLLLGLDVEDTLEVTACFPSLDATTEAESDAADAYQIDMMKCLRMANVDCYTVGWYQSTYLSSFLNESMIMNQFSYQENLDKCVCVVYDPMLSKDGKLSLKAVRLTDSFMNLYRRQNFTRDSLKEFLMGDQQDIFEEIPIRIHNSHLIKGALWDLCRPKKNEQELHFGMLDNSTNPYLTKNIQFMLECIDDLSMEHGKLQYYHRSLGRQRMQQDMRRREMESRGEGKAAEEEEKNFRALQEPSRLESLLITNQISSHCDQLGGLAGWIEQ